MLAHTLNEPHVEAFFCVFMLIIVVNTVVFVTCIDHSLRGRGVLLVLLD